MSPFKYFARVALGAALLYLNVPRSYGFSVTFSEEKYLLHSQTDHLTSIHNLFLPIIGGEFLHEADGSKVTSNLFIAGDDNGTTVRLAATVEMTGPEAGSSYAMYYGLFTIDAPAFFDIFGMGNGNGTAQGMGSISVQLDQVANESAGFGGGAPNLFDLSLPTHQGFLTPLLLPSGTYRFYISMDANDFSGVASYSISGDVGMSITAATVPDQSSSAGSLAGSLLVLFLLGNRRTRIRATGLTRLFKKCRPRPISLSPIGCVAAFVLGVLPQTTFSLPVSLQNATATFSQSGQNVSGTIDGNATGGGWAIFEFSGAPNATHAQEAVFETVLDQGFAGGSVLTFVLSQNHGSQHALGRFRFSVTTDPRNTFADGLQSGGDVEAGWTILDPDPSFLNSSSGGTLTALGDGSIVASGVNPLVDTYTIRAATALVGITGFRLEVLEHPDLPTGGPGRQPSNGNFVLSELTIDIAAAPPASVPDAPSSVLLLISSLFLMAIFKMQRRSISPTIYTTRKNSRNAFGFVNQTAII